jgi:hypothetical protein
LAKNKGATYRQGVTGFAGYRQVSQERLDLTRAHRFRMAFSMMQNEPAKESARKPARFGTSSDLFAA